MNKKSFIELISIFIEKNIKKIFIIWCIVVAVLPLLIWGLHLLFSTFVFVGYSVDGLLSFGGVIISSLSSMLVACVALYQNHKANEAVENLETEKRRNKIKPCLQVELQKSENNCFEIIVTNHSNNSAIGVYIFEKPLFAAVTSRKKLRRTISFLNNDNDSLYISNEWVEFCVDDGYPKEIELIYLDIDNNVLVQKFQRDMGNIYNPCEVEYY